MKATKKLSISAIMSALGVCIVWLGSLLEVMDLSAVALAGFIIAFAHIELKGYYPYLIYASTSILLLVVMPAKLGALMYVLFGGIYPTVKLYAERMIKPLCLACKGASFVVFIALGALGMYIIGDAFLQQKTVYLVALAAFSFFVLVVYDYALTMVINYYVFRLRPKIQKYLK